MRGLVSLSGLNVGLLLVFLALSAARPVAAAAAPATETPTPIATVNPTYAACVGNCNGDSVVAVNELIAGVNIALGNAAWEPARRSTGMTTAGWRSTSSSPR